MYICIDLKSFYASVECVERGLDPLDTNLVVADPARTEKTICLAVTPSLKAYGLPGRARLFEVVKRVGEVNRERQMRAPSRRFSGSSDIASQLTADPCLKMDFITAPPRMAHYMKVSTAIYSIYLRYIAPEDIHVYSIDEVFIDVSAYLKTYGCTAHELALRMIRTVLRETGITATAGIGTNMYLAKIAMDIVAKKMPADKDGVRIAELDEMEYRRQLWNHRPLTDFWRVGRGISQRLEAAGLYTMGDIARISEQNEDLLYKMFGVNAQLLIDHAWGWEPCTIAEVKAYVPESRSLSQGQILQRPYAFSDARLICREMTDILVLDLVQKGLVCDQLVLTVGYDHTGIPEGYRGEMHQNHYGKTIPKQAHGSVSLGTPTSSSKRIIRSAMELFDRIVDKELFVRRMYVVVNRICPEQEAAGEEDVQLSLFDDPEAIRRRQEQEREQLLREKNLQRAVISIKERYGRNAILKGMNFQENATARERNRQVGGHKA